MENQIDLHSVRLHYSVQSRITRLIQEAKCLRMSVAYWTIDENYFGSSLLNLLAKENSFACIDLSLPTDISKVCEIAGKTNSIYLYTKSVVQDNTEEKMADHLLHSKILMFDLPEDKASIWIGSHNWTRRSLSGINIETSIEILVEQSSPIYKQTKRLLSEIKKECHKVNTDLEEVYKNAQRADKSFLYLESELADNNINKGKDLVFHLLFNHNNPNYITYNRVIFLFLRSSIDRNIGYLFKGSIKRIGSAKSSALDFPDLKDGYYCFITTGSTLADFKHTDFKHTSHLDIEEKEKSLYFATIVADYKQDITDINSQFFSEYKPAINIPQRLITLKFLFDSDSDSEFLEDSNYPRTFEDKLDLENFLNDVPNSKKEGLIFVRQPLIDKDSIVENYMGRITPKEIAKIIKKMKDNLST